MALMFLIVPEGDPSDARPLILEANNPAEAVELSLDPLIWGFSPNQAPFAVHEVVLTTRFAVVEDRGDLKCLILSVDDPPIDTRGNREA